MVTIHGKKAKIVPFFVPDDNPFEMQPVNHFQSTSGTLCPSTSCFKEMAFKKLMLCKPKTSKPLQKWLKVNPLGGVVTSDEQFEEILAESQKERRDGEGKEREKRERKKENWKNETRKNFNKGNKKQSIKGRKLPAKEKIDDYNEKSEDSETSDSEWDEDVFEDEQPESTEKCLFPPKNNIQAYKYLSTI